VGKRDLLLSSSSDSAWAATSATAAKAPHIQEQPSGSVSGQECGRTGPAKRVQLIILRAVPSGRMGSQGAFSQLKR